MALAIWRDHITQPLALSCMCTSAKNILLHVLHTYLRYLPISSGNTIPPYSPCAPYISFFLSKPTGPWGVSNHTPSGIYLLLWSESPSWLHQGRCVATPTLVFFWFFLFNQVGHCAPHMCLCTCGIIHPCLVGLSHLSCYMLLDFSLIDCLALESSGVPIERISGQ